MNNKVCAFDQITGVQIKIQNRKNSKKNLGHKGIQNNKNFLSFLLRKNDDNC